MAAQRQSTTQEAPELSPGDRHWDDEFNAITSNLKNAEAAGGNMGDFENSYNNPTASGAEESAVGRARDILKSKEEQGGSNTAIPTEGTWANKVIPKTITNQNQLAKVLLKRGGPAGAVLAVVLVAGGLLGGILGPGSLLINLKENLTLRWDQQAYTTEIRSRAILAKRFSSQTTAGCGVVKVICRYKVPSNKILNDLDTAGIKALTKDGNIINKQRLIGGERPAYYFFGENLDDAAFKKAVQSGDFAGYKLIDAANFKKELTNNSTFRSAFRRAYNPRWVNWVDDAGMAFLKKMGITKAVSSAVGDAADSKALREALETGADGKLGSLGEADDAAAKALKELAENEIADAAETQAKNVVKKGKSDTAILAAAAACASIRAPGIITSVIGKIKLSAMVAVVVPTVLTLADKMKAGDATPREVENVATLYTHVTNTTDASGKTVRGKSAMDSGAILYGVTGDKGSAARSTTLKKYLPGYTGNTAVSTIAALGQNRDVKKSCDMMTGTEAQVAASAIKAAKATNLAGWIALGADALVFVADKTGVINAAIDGLFVPLIQAGVASLSSILDWNGIMQSMSAGFIANAQDEELGDMTGVTIASFLGNAASSSGNVPMTPAQKVAFDQTVVKPTQLAWAQEDRLTHSPLDASNPNTFLGSITTQLMPYYSSLSSFTGIFTSAFKLVGSVPNSFLLPSAYADESESDWNLCPEDGDLSIAMSGVAAGPLCDVQYAIPTEYIDADPEAVAQFLYDNRQIDADGNTMPNSDYENWERLCTTNNNYSLGECVIPDMSAAGTDATAQNHIKMQAYMALYTIDKRTIDGMDNEPQLQAESTTDSGYATPSGTCPTGTSIVNGITTGWDKNTGNPKNITLCSVPDTQTSVFDYWKNSNYKGTSSLNIDTIVVNAEAAAALKQLADKYRSETHQELSASISYRSVWEQCSFFAPGAEKKNTVDSTQKGLYNKYCQPGIDAEWLKGHGGDWSTQFVTSNHELGYSIDFTDGAAKKWLKQCVRDATDGKSDNRCYGFYDDVFQRENWDEGHFTYSP